MSDSEYFAQGSLKYRNIFNHETGFFHPKDEAGKFIEPFDYSRSGGMGARGYYGENNGWVYRWDVPHNIADLIDLMGGNDRFVAELDRMFAAPLGSSKYEFYSQLPDHTGNVGQFSMANEPSLHVPYLYNYAGYPWKTQKRIRTLLKQWFRNDLMGVPGDEDGGGMSAFVVFSMMGFYPVTPGLPIYVIGSPVVDYAEVDLGNGKTFTVISSNNSSENKYILSARLNGESLDRSWFTHEELMAGGTLELEMGNKPNKQWGTSEVPPSFKL
jgi:predicted alpha-1,2-mannosidase